jgi:hypothetical protein
MRHRKSISIQFLILSVLLVLTLALVFSCSEQPTALDREPGDMTGGGTIDPGASGSFLLGTVSDSTLAPGYIELWAMNVAFHDSTGITTFDVQLRNRTTRDIHPPIHFVITDIIPDNIAVVDFDGVSGDGRPFYDFSAKLGSDNILSPDERSEPVTMKFHTVTPRSFAIGFRIDLGPPPGGGTIGGVVFRDDNKDGKRERCDRCEPGIPGITVALEKPLAGGDVVTLITRTGENGEYSFAGLKEGVYKVFVAPPLEKWVITSTNPLLVTLVKGPDGKVQDFFEAHFGLFPIEPPVPGNLFGPIIIGPFSRFGTELDSTFVNPPSVLPVVFHYYLDVTEPPYMTPIRGVVDSAAAWINGEMVFEYHETMPPDTAYFTPQTIELRDGLVKEGENRIYLVTKGNEHAGLMWRVYKQP